MTGTELITVSQAAEISSYSAKHIRHLCATGKIEGAVLMGKTWILPKDALGDYKPGPRGFKPGSRKTATKAPPVGEIAEAVSK